MSDARRVRQLGDESRRLSDSSWIVRSESGSLPHPEWRRPDELPLHGGSRSSRHAAGEVAPAGAGAAQVRLPGAVWGPAARHHREPQEVAPALPARRPTGEATSAPAGCGHGPCAAHSGHGAKPAMVEGRHVGTPSNPRPFRTLNIVDDCARDAGMALDGRMMRGTWPRDWNLLRVIESPPDRTGTTRRGCDLALQAGLEPRGLNYPEWSWRTRLLDALSIGRHLDRTSHGQ